MGDRPDKYLTEWSTKRDAWLRSGRKDDSFLLRGAELSAFRAFVINEPQRVTSDDRGFLLACDRRADTSGMMRSQDLEAILLDHAEVTVVGEAPAIPALALPHVAAPHVAAPHIAAPHIAAPAAPEVPKPPAPRRRWTVVLLAVNVVLILGMLGLGLIVKERLVQLSASKSELERTQAALLKKTEAIGQVHDDLTQKSKAKEVLEKVLPTVQAQRDDASKVLDSLTQERRSAEDQLKAVESALAVAQQEIINQRGRRPKGKLKVEFDRLLVKRLLLMLPPRCPKDLADCNDAALQESLRKLSPKGTLRSLIAPLPHVVIYPRSVATNAKMLPVREGQLRSLLKPPGDRSDLLVVICPRLADEKGAQTEARYQLLLEFLQKSLKLAPERLLRLNQTGLFVNGGFKGLTPAERSKNGESNPAEAIWVVRAPGPRPIPAPAVQPS